MIGAVVRRGVLVRLANMQAARSASPCLLVEGDWGFPFSTLAFIGPADLAFQAAGSSQQQPSRGLPPTRRQLDTQVPTLSAATASAASLKHPTAAPAAAPEAAGAGAGAGAAEAAGSGQSMAQRLREAHTRGKHRNVLAQFAAAGLGKGAASEAQRSMFETALRSCARLGDARRARELVAAMWRRPGVFVGPAAHLSVVQALCSAGELEQAYGYLVGIPGRSARGRRRLRIFMCNAVLATAVSQGDVRVAQQVEALITRRGLAPDALTYASLMGLRGLEGRADQVAALYQQATEVCGGEAQASLRAAHAIGLARGGALDAAIDAIEAMMNASAGLLPIPLPTPSPLPAPLQRTPHRSQQQQQQQHAAAQPPGRQQQQQQQHWRQGEEEEVQGTWGAGGSSRHTTPLEYLRGACNAVLKQAEDKGDQGAVRRLTGLMTLRGLPPDTKTYNLLLRAAGRRAPDAAAAVAAVEAGVAEMEALGVPPNQETYELLAGARGTAGDLEGASRVLADMQGAGWALSVAARAAFMRHCAAAGDLEGVGAAFDQLLQSEQQRTAGMYRAAFNAIREWGISEASQRALAEGAGASATNMRIHQRQLAAALLQRWVGEMEALRIHHTPASFTALLHAFSFAGQPELLVQLLHRAFGQLTAAAASSAASGAATPGAEQPRGTACSNSNSGGGSTAGSSSPLDAEAAAGAAPAFAAAAQPAAAAGVAEPDGGNVPAQAAAAAAAVPKLFVHSVVPGRLQPDARMFSAAIGGVARLGRLQDAVALLRLMRAAGLEPSVHTYTSLIACCAFVRMPGLARSLFSEMRARGVPPSLHTHNALLKVEAHCGGLDRAVELVQDMELQGPAPDAVSWRTLFAAAKFLGRADVQDLARRRLLGMPDDDEEGEEAEEGSEQQQPQQQGEGGWENYYASGEDEDDE